MIPWKCGKPSYFTSTLLGNSVIGRHRFSLPMHSYWTVCPPAFSWILRNNNNKLLHKLFKVIFGPWCLRYRNVWEEIYLYVELFALCGIIWRNTLKLKYFTVQGLRMQSWNVPLPEVAKLVVHRPHPACRHAFLWSIYLFVFKSSPEDMFSLTF